MPAAGPDFKGPMAEGLMTVPDVEVLDWLVQSSLPSAFWDSGTDTPI